jgi:hypothetical protein
VPQLRPRTLPAQLPMAPHTLVLVVASSPSSAESTTRPATWAAKPSTASKNASTHATRPVAVSTSVSPDPPAILRTVLDLPSALLMFRAPNFLALRALWAVLRCLPQCLARFPAAPRLRPPLSPNHRPASAPAPARPPLQVFSHAQHRTTLSTLWPLATHSSLSAASITKEATYQARQSTPSRSASLRATPHLHASMSLCPVTCAT